MNHEVLKPHLGDVDGVAGGVQDVAGGVQRVLRAAQ